MSFNYFKGETMGLYNFVVGAGKSILSSLGHHATDKEKIDTIRKEISELGVPQESLSISLMGDVATIAGEVESVEQKEKIVLAVGNIKEIGSVKDEMRVKASPTHSTQAKQNESSAFYTVKSGDNLSKIAREQYGNASMFQRIFEANRPMLKSPDEIYPGQVLRIPPQSA